MRRSKGPRRPGAWTLGPVAREAEDRLVVELKDLETRSFESPALSLYLTIGGDDEAPGRYLDPLLRELAEEDGDADDREYASALSGEIRRVERELEDSRPLSSVAIFSCRPAGLLEVFELPDEVPPMMVFGEQLETIPLRLQMERHPEAVVHRPHAVEARSASGQ
jgi:hypothetical protein